MGFGSVVDWEGLRTVGGDELVQGELARVRIRNRVTGKDRMMGMMMMPEWEDIEIVLL